MENIKQKINIAQENASCLRCGANLLDIKNIKWLKKDLLGDTFKEELFECRKCGQQFIIHYDLFDDDGHINPRAFTGDINDLTYNWQDNLSKEQKKKIESHLKNCPICQDRLEEENLQDAWFASIIHGANNE